MAGSVMMLVLFPFAQTRADPLAIDQNAWLNYAVIVNVNGKPSNLQIGQFGTLNGISSAQVSGSNDAYIMTHQRGEWNSALLYQSGWNTIVAAVQQGNGSWPGFTHHSTVYRGLQTDEGYLSYFMTGGFSFVSLTDPGHTWYSRFGRGR
jgi:hypothetical protein